MSVKPVPERFHAVTPYLTVRGTDKLLDFVKRAFGAKEHHVSRGPGGAVMHAHASIADSHIMMGEAHGEWQPMPCCLYLYVPEVDTVYRRALEAGGTSVSEPADQFYGDRHGGVKDPVGNLWWIATH